MMNYQREDELMHYGVLGMKWGVRRGTSQLTKARSTGNRDLHSKGVTTLRSHKTKINKKLADLDSRGERLEQKRYETVTKDDVKIAKYNKKSTKLRRKASVAYFPIHEHGLTKKANKLDVKVAKLEDKHAKLRAKIEKNERLKNAMNSGLKDIDRVLMDDGKDFIKKYS